MGFDVVAEPFQTESPEEYERLIVAPVPLIDVRSPLEFSAGAVPGAVNLPLLADRERHQVGLCYRQQGREAALALGHRLLAGTRRDQVVAAWDAYLSSHPEAWLYCARGGLRSAIAGDWIATATGRRVSRLSGGYKGFRAYLLSRLEPSTITSAPLVLGGRTGSGKTRLLHRLPNSVDLEALANHRGSAFGSFLTVQPSQADFENRLAAALIRHHHAHQSRLLVEDEGRHVGKRFLPRALSQFFAGAPLVLLEVDLDSRIETIVDEYVVAAQALYRERFGEDVGMERWLADMEDGALRLVKRLGRSRVEDVRRRLARGCADQLRSGDHESHRSWVELLLTDYYDPMYDYQIGKKAERVVFRGTWDEVLHYLQEVSDN